jgi:DNA-binding Lrp family transcriptional regulator
MKDAQIIKGATIHINYKGFGYKAVASLLIEIAPHQTDKIIEYVKKLPDIYAVYNLGPRGNIRIVASIRSLQQLDEVKDAIKRDFLISNMKTTIWTDVREMNSNLDLLPEESTTPKIEQETFAIKKKTNHIEIDEIDLKITEQLAENGRAPIGKIAKAAGISSDLAKKRYKKLKQNGILKVTIQTDPTKMGYHAIALFYVSTAQHENSLCIIDTISQIPDVISIMKTSGDYDLQIYAMIKDIDELLIIQEQIGKIQGITKMDMELSKCSRKWPTPRQHMSTF